MCRHQVLDEFGVEWHIGAGQSVTGQSCGKSFVAATFGISAGTVGGLAGTPISGVDAGLGAGLTSEQRTVGSHGRAAEQNGLKPPVELAEIMLSSSLTHRGPQPFG